MSEDVQAEGRGVPGGGPAAAPRATFSAVLKNRNFRNLWVGQVVSQIGDYFAVLAMMLMVSGGSGSVAGLTTSVSGVMIAATAPRLLFGVLAGVFVDRWDRRRTMIASDLLRMVLTLALIAVFVANSRPLLYALAFALSTVSTFFNPARSALLPRLVPDEQLVSANALSQTGAVLANLLGPALAGGVFALVGAGREWIAFVIDALSFLASAVAIYAIRTPGDAAEPSREEGSPLGRTLREMKDGMRILLMNRTVSTLAAAVAVAMLGLGAVNVLWIVFLKVRFAFEGPDLAFRLSVGHFGFFSGMVVSGVIAGNVLSGAPPRRFIVGGLVGAGASTVALVLLPTYGWVVAGMVVTGLFVAPIHTGIGALLQRTVPNRKLGRVSGGISTVTDTATILSMSLAGIVSGLRGIHAVFVVAGLACVAGGLVAWVFLPVREGLAAADEASPAQDAGSV